ncbi:hypothetical protein [Saccharibacillus kuerlensis]|uniref:Uncharacterized protein n=1 Tax=Saccharibacillus kuerlensis TaxID=459527 RepID=A0ABQ2L3F2_9BACL|nr:hypothetical protein [Saccharibacillus kuerlensis]GGN99684.1 hypothetical protein GCM10010969_20000 [Saccharibacillus kuerlensis]
MDWMNRMNAAFDYIETRLAKENFVYRSGKSCLLSGPAFSAHVRLCHGSPYFEYGAGI